MLLSLLNEMSVGPLWLLRTPPVPSFASVPDAELLSRTDGSEFVNESVSESVAEPVFHSVSGRIADIDPGSFMPGIQPSDNISDTGHCLVCGNGWLADGVQDSDALVVLATALSNPPEQQLLAQCLWAAGWREPQVCFALHAACSDQASVASLAALRAQISRQCPQVIVVFGATAAQWLIADDRSAPVLRGESGHYANVRVVVTHDLPELISKPALKAELWADLCLAQYGLE